VYGIALQCVVVRPNIVCQKQIAVVRGFWKYFECMALRCSVLQCDPISCVSSKMQQFVGVGSISSVWHCVAVCCSATQYRVSTANCSSSWVLEVLQCVAVCCSVLQHDPISCVSSELQQFVGFGSFTVYRSVLQCVAMC